MTDYVQNFFKEIKEKQDGLYNVICRLASEKYLIYYLCHKSLGNSSLLEEAIIECLNDTATIDLHDVYMIHDAGLLAIAKGEIGRGKKILGHAKYICDKLLKTEEDEILINIYKCRKQECEYVLENVNKIHMALESAYSEFCKTEDPKKAILALSIEKQKARAIMAARINATLSEENKGSLDERFIKN